MRTTGNANPAGGHYQELTALKLGSIFLKQSIEVFDFGLQGRSWKPKEHEAAPVKFEAELLTGKCNFAGILAVIFALLFA